MSDAFAALQMLAADNARLCERLLAAEKVVEETRRLLRYCGDVPHSDTAEKALESYDAGRPS